MVLQLSGDKNMARSGNTCSAAGFHHTVLEWLGVGWDLKVTRTYRAWKLPNTKLHLSINSAPKLIQGEL